MNWPASWQSSKRDADELFSFMARMIATLTRSACFLTNNYRSITSSIEQYIDNRSVKLGLDCDQYDDIQESLL